jgi:hypothetical protein
MQRYRTWWMGFVYVVMMCAACGGRGDTPEGDARTDEATGSRPGSPVVEYLEFAAADDSPAGGDAAYVADGLRKLAGALGELGIGGPELGVDLRVTAEHVLLAPASETTAAAVRTVLVSAADALGEAEAESEALRAAAGSIATDQPLDAQAAAVGRFFQEAAGVLERRAPPR